MGARGPKPGWKQAKAKAAKKAAAQAKLEASKAAEIETKPTATQAAAGPVLIGETPLSELSAAQRNNPRYLTGSALRDLAHRKGLPKSTVADMPDAKIREQLRYIEAHRAETAEA